MNHIFTFHRVRRCIFLVRISLLCPTRKRPQNMLAMFHSALYNADKPTDVECVFCIDDDDVTAQKQFEDMRKVYGNQIKARIGKRVILAQTWNECLPLASGDIIMHCNDDIIFRTKGWDTIVRDEFDKCYDKILCVYGRDGFQNERLATFGFYGRKLAEILGYFTPPYFSCDYCDNWLFAIHKTLNRARYHPEIYIEHLHPTAGKAVIDETHRDRLNAGARDNVNQLWVKLQPQLVQDIIKVANFINRWKQIRLPWMWLPK